MYGLHESFEHLEVMKTHKVKHRKDTKNRGTMLTVFAIANRLGGWQYPACRKGAITYCLNAYKFGRAELVSEQNWTGMTLIRFSENLIETTTSSEWTKEVTNIRTEDTNKFVWFAKVNRAKTCWIWMNWSDQVKEPSGEKLALTENGIEGFSHLLYTLPEDAKLINIPFTGKCKEKLDGGKGNRKAKKGKGGGGKGESGNGDGGARVAAKPKQPKAKDPFTELKSLHGEINAALKDLKDMDMEATEGPEKIREWAPARAYLDSALQVEVNLNLKIQDGEKVGFVNDLGCALLCQRKLVVMKKEPNWDVTMMSLLNIYRTEKPNLDPKNYCLEP